MADEKTDPEANEPIGFYNSRKITFYKSFEEENEAKIAYYATLTPIQCMAQLNAMLKQFYKTKLAENRGLDKKIIFDWMDIFFDEHKQILTALLQSGVEFILVGGYAVNVHGYVRATNDMDIWLKPDNQNKQKLAELLLSMNYDKDGVAFIAGQDFERPFVFHIGEAPLAIDFITKISGVTFEDADRNKVYLPVGDIQIPVLHLHHLILSKTGTGRLKDAADIEYLQKIEAKRNEGWNPHGEASLKYASAWIPHFVGDGIFNLPTETNYPR